jgi:acetyltransferase-like isoleucine patch superfamily enzyme
VDYRAKLLQFFRNSLPNKSRFLRLLWARLITAAYYRRVFGSIGNGTILETPLRLHNPIFIRIGTGVYIGEGARLEALVSSAGATPKLIIEDDVSIENHVQLIAHCSVVIRRNAGIGPRCVIMDASHPFMDMHDPRPIYRRLSTAPSFVEIGEGAQIGAGTFITPNVRIGKGSVIGPNSVVRRSVPDHCVAAGNPAKIMLRYHPADDRWLPES